jgi:hypothetical protein
MYKNTIFSAFCLTTDEACQNGGICLTDETVPECHCPEGFEGKYCEHDIGKSEK